MKLRTVLSLLSLLLLVTCLIAQPTKQNDWLLLSLKGKVSTLIENKIDEIDTIPGRVHSYINEYHFNYNGYITHSTQRRIDKDKPFSTMHITYDSLNNKTSEILSGKLYIYKNEYNERNRLVIKTDYDSSMVLQSFHMYKYDAQDRLIVLANYNQNSTLRRKTIFTYDNNNATTAKLYRSNGELWSTAKYAANFSNNKVYDRYKSEAQIHVWKYEYDLMGRMVVARTNRKAGKGINKYSYNEHDDQLTHTVIVYKLTKAIYKYTSVYEYDTVGNWTKKTTYADGSKIETITRQINYY